MHIYIDIYTLTACGEGRKYISEHRQNAHNDGNRAQPLKRLFETLFLAIKKYIGLLLMFLKSNTLYTIFFLVCFSLTYEASLYDSIISFYRWKQPLTAAKAAVHGCCFKIRVLKNFVIFTGKNLCWCLLLIKLQP